MLRFFCKIIDWYKPSINISVKVKSPYLQPVVFVILRKNVSNVRGYKKYMIKRSNAKINRFTKRREVKESLDFQIID